MSDLRKIIVTVEGGIVQGFAADGSVEFSVIDHDVFSSCTNRDGSHWSECPDHSAEDFKVYRELIARASEMVVQG